MPAFDTMSRFYGFDILQTMFSSHSVAFRRIRS